MKYFVSIRESYYNTSRKELFYQALMKKRIGKDNYTLHKYKCEYNLSAGDLLKKSDNPFSQYIIEFSDIKSFTKFKISYKNLLNPSLTNPSERIISCKSFIIEDDFKENLIKLKKEYEAVNRRRTSIQNIIHNYSRLTYFLNGIKGSINGIKNDENVNNFPKEFVDKDDNLIKYICESYDNIKTVIDNYGINDTAHAVGYIDHNTKLENIPEDNLNYIYLERLNELKNEAKGLFMDVVDLEIPTTNKVAN